MKRIFVISMMFFCFSIANAQYNNSLKIELVLKTDTTSIGQKINYPQFLNDEISILKITVPPGASTGWHKHVFPVFAYIVKGTLTVEIEKLETKIFKENTSFSEVINVNHNGINKGKEDVILIAFFMGEKGKELSIHQ